MGHTDVAPPQRGARRVRKEDFVPHLPPQHYIDLSRAPPTASDPPPPKLLVLDLNGALLYRTKNNSPRRSYPRPFLHNFLEYLMKAEPGGARGPYEVLVWSSAQPHNVRNMVETTFGRWCAGIWRPKPQLAEGEQRLLNVWARDKMNLGADFHHNVQTTKDLRDVIKEIPRYAEQDVLLLDDSPFKATEQPWSHIIVSEFAKDEYAASLAAAHRFDRAPEAAGADPSAEAGMDTILLAAVGILEALRFQDNIPAWVRSGGIGAPGGEPADTSAEVTLATLPSAATFEHWFAVPAVREHWVAAGKAALARKGIPLSHGLAAAPLAAGSGGGGSGGGGSGGGGSSTGPSPAEPESRAPDAVGDGERAPQRAPQRAEAAAPRA